VQEEPKVKVKGGLWGSKKGAGAGGAAVAEGRHLQQQELAHISIHPMSALGASAGSVSWQGGDIPEGYDLNSLAGEDEGNSSSSSELDQQQDYDSTDSGVVGGGPVCEGRDQQQVKPSVQFQQVDDSELAQRAKSVSSTPVQQKVQVRVDTFSMLTSKRVQLLPRQPVGTSS
jgi:hypothetical protein